jgi:hypothetical protein
VGWGVSTLWYFYDTLLPYITKGTTEDVLERKIIYFLKNSKIYVYIRVGVIAIHSPYSKVIKTEGVRASVVQR